MQQMQEEQLAAEMAAARQVSAQKLAQAAAAAEQSTVASEAAAQAAVQQAETIAQSAVQQAVDVVQAENQQPAAEVKTEAPKAETAAVAAENLVSEDDVVVQMNFKDEAPSDSVKTDESKVV